MKIRITTNITVRFNRGSVIVPPVLTFEKNDSRKGQTGKEWIQVRFQKT